MSKHKVWSAEDLFNEVNKYMNKDHVDIIKKAYNYASDCHEGQSRQSGEPYIVHPIQVASILAQLRMDPETISAGLLHDVVEDTNATLDDIDEKFGKNVEIIVDGVTKLGKIKYKSNQEQLAENHRKLLLAMCSDIRVMIVKLADRLHNMRTLRHLKPEKQWRISNETLEIYAPLADRLGIGTIKWELEDISLRYLNPQQYYKIVHLMNSKRNERVAYVNEAVKEVKKQVSDMNLPNVEVYGRPKHLYSIYRKMVIKHKKFGQIYDLLAVRCIVDSIKDCYAVLGAIHTKWSPMPGRFKDYIAMPKANMYQSLHTTVFGPGGKPLEVQIRTKKMHQIAEYGVAAHWAYKEGMTDEVQASSDNNRLNWFKRIIEIQEDTDNASEFMDGVKGELFGDHVYAFTPQGDVLELPKGAGPLDMAYLIHTDVGNHTTGAKVNGVIEPLDYEIKTGDIVAIMTSTSSTGPSQDWENLVTTSRAKHKIRQFFRHKDREKNIAIGKDLLNQAIKDNGYDISDVLTKPNMDRLLNKTYYKSIDDMYAELGFGNKQPNGLVNILTLQIRDDAEKKRQEQEQKDILENHQTIEKNNNHPNNKNSKLNKPSDGVVIKDVDNLLIRLSHCCAPVPGDKIVGYITKGRGVSVHRDNCPNVIEDDDRLVNVNWDIPDDSHTLFNAYVQVEGYNRNSMLNDVIKNVSGVCKQINSVEGKVDHDKTVTISLKISVKNLAQLEMVMNHVKNVHDVYFVKRPFK
ncbi:RelA/SpoT family protein [Apilactobacillus timberlakei]|uniref:GTP diphosphokinase n=1 Tax=Apilactobacillus timberlakei TaxID=2008380 RepID=A0ABY2YYK1_9LACO|nr:bifunctional (p)ppGpp synthetase/guanosine-3',5'-bis(diphosphate) 3'-pyrophosphohydrolase [Apilactobacillus timberlakei]TPR13850.1 bifunctional (p)ppGpp synthetase/guanosine-3',5'-bis(diphosphate) 3'-pyrophosphohydrolase [Apilactobacillus timberlakei]TPR15166.1 bifunctional (p)ppGpp synthetase/guanosine-3',5'-bis(diphosphate) 3'-pyrophosphohydrolase [Apilactobacillus timberlakei]TPR17057.1 bifunctional (p)ppGpp synthetase/guanosine-3',5'-bis(diphosphate) 3'-pyrophosphohydrolase [Apilactobacil